MTSTTIETTKTMSDSFSSYSSSSNYHHNHRPSHHSLGDDADNTATLTNDIDTNNHTKKRNEDDKEQQQQASSVIIASDDIIDEEDNGSIQSQKEYVQGIVESTIIQTNEIKVSTNSPSPSPVTHEQHQQQKNNFQKQHQYYNPNNNQSNESITNNNNNNNNNNTLNNNNNNNNLNNSNNNINIEIVKRRNLNSNRNSSDSLPCSPPSSPPSPGKVYFGKLSSNSIPDRTVIYSPINNTKYHIKDIILMMKTPPNGLLIKDRYTGFQYHKQCFTGFDMVEWLLTHGICATRNHCIQLGQYLLDKSIIRHVYCDQPFRDSNLLYVFKEFLGISDDKIYIIVQKMKQQEGGVERKDRSKLFKKYKDCFIGSEAVTWLLENNPREVGARDEAIRLCQEIMDLGLIVPASNSKDVFRDDGTFYIFRNIIYGGYLGKKKKNSQERKIKYFALKEGGENILWYYDSPKDPLSNTGINLNNAYIRECKCGGGADCFEIVSHQRIFCLKCSNFSFLRLWVEILSHQTTTISDENALFEEAEEYIKEDSIRQSDLFFESFNNHQQQNNSPMRKSQQQQQQQQQKQLTSEIENTNDTIQHPAESTTSENVHTSTQTPATTSTPIFSPDTIITPPITNNNMEANVDNSNSLDNDDNTQVDNHHLDELQQLLLKDDGNGNGNGDENDEDDTSPSTNTCDDYYNYNSSLTTSRTQEVKKENEQPMVKNQSNQQQQQQSIGISSSQSDLITFNSSTNDDTKTELGISTQSFLIDSSNSQIPFLNHGSMDSIIQISPQDQQQQSIETTEEQQ